MAPAVGKIFQHVPSDSFHLHSFFFNKFDLYIHPHSISLFPRHTFDLCIGEESFEHANVLSEKINFSAPGGRKVAIFGMEDLDPLYLDVSNISVQPPSPLLDV